MDVYKLKTTDRGFKKIERAQFESDTAMTWPYYQKNDAGTTSQFAVCPACNNPTQLILLYPEKADCVRRAYGKHVSHDVDGIAAYDQGAYEACPYASLKKSAPDSKRKPSTISSGILHILQEQFDRVVYMIGKMTGIGISSRMAESMLRSYLANEGYLYFSSTLMNIPWMLAYRSGSHSLYGQIIVNEELRQRILEKIDGAYFNERNQLLCREGKFLNVQFCFSGHASKVEDNSLKETMEFMVTQVFDKKPNALYRDMERIHQCTLELDHFYFQNLIQLPENHPNRNMRLVEMARTLIRA